MRNPEMKQSGGVEISGSSPAGKDILEMNPHQIIDYLDILAEQDKLETFLKQVASNPEQSAQLSYWEKWLEKDHSRMLDELLAFTFECF